MQDREICTYFETETIKPKNKMETNTSLVIANLNDNIQTLAKIALINLPDGTSLEKAQRTVMKEIVNFEMACTMNPLLANPAIDKASILIAVKQAIADNLSLSPNAGLVYLIPGKVQVGIDPKTNAKIYKEVLNYSPTAEGILSMSRQSGSILDHKRPVCTYDSAGKVDTVTFEFMVPAYPAPRWESITFNKDNFAKWQQKSAAKFGGNSNPNYTAWNGGIDPEFAASKAIKHGLKKRGRNSNETISHYAISEVKPEVKAEVKNNAAPEVKAETNNNIEDVHFEDVKPEIKTEPADNTNTVTENDLF